MRRHSLSVRCRSQHSEQCIHKKEMKVECNDYVGEELEEKPTNYAWHNFLLSCWTRLSNQRNPMNDAELYTSSCLHIGRSLDGHFTMPLAVTSAQCTEHRWNIQSSFQALTHKSIHCSYLPQKISPIKNCLYNCKTYKCNDMVTRVRCAGLNYNCFNNSMG